jgi:hypothetical protein
MTNEREVTLQAFATSLRDVHSLRDFVAALLVGAEVTLEMLDGIEAHLLAIARVVDTDQTGGNP